MRISNVLRRGVTSGVFALATAALLFGANGASAAEWRGWNIHVEGYPNTGAGTADRLHIVLETARHAVLVAETRELAIIGWIHVFGAPRVESDAFAELGGLVVAESSRGKGVGTQLVASAKRWALGAHSR